MWLTAAKGKGLEVLGKGSVRNEARVLHRVQAFFTTATYCKNLLYYLSLFVVGEGTGEWEKRGREAGFSRWQKPEEIAKHYATLRNVLQ